MRNTLVDLNNILFEMIERVNDDSLSPSELDIELKKSKSVVDISKVIVSNASLVLNAEIKAKEYGTSAEKLLIGGKK